MPLVRQASVDPEVRQLLLLVLQQLAGGQSMSPLRVHVQLQHKEETGALMLLPLACACRAGCQVGVYLNRLSDYLFTAARYAVSSSSSRRACSCCRARMLCHACCRAGLMCLQSLC